MNVLWIRERWALLYQMFPQQPKISELRIDRSLVVHRTIFEVENKVGGDTICTRLLDQVAMGQGFALQASQYQEAMDQSFAVMYSNLSSRRQQEKTRTRQHQAERL